MIKTTRELAASYLGVALFTFAYLSPVFAFSETPKSSKANSASNTPDSLEIRKSKLKGKLTSPAFGEEWDFGYVPVGYKLVYQTYLKNVGADTLQLLDIVTTCECTTPKIGRDILAPDSATMLTINFDTEKFSGHQARFIEVHSTDQYAPERLVQFKAMVGGRPPEAALLPASMLILGSQQGDSLVIKNYLSKKLPFRVVFIDSNLFTLESEFDYLPPGGFTHFFLQANDSVSAGEHYSTLTIELATTPPARISMPIKLIRR